MQTENVQGKSWKVQLSDKNEYTLKEPSSLAYAQIELIPHPIDTFMTVLSTLQILLIDSYQDEPEKVAKFEDMRHISTLCKMKDLKRISGKIDTVVTAGIPKNLLAPEKKTGQKSASRK